MTNSLGMWYVNAIFTTHCYLAFICLLIYLLKKFTLNISNVSTSDEQSSILKLLKSIVIQVAMSVNEKNFPIILFTWSY